MQSSGAYVRPLSHRFWDATRLPIALANGIEIFDEDGGQGPSIVCIHALGATHRTGGPMAVALGTNGS